jgi:hypothetical protein
LGLDRVFAGAVEGLDAEALLDLLEEQFDLQAAFIESADRSGGHPSFKHGVLDGELMRPARGPWIARGCPDRQPCARRLPRRGQAIFAEYGIAWPSTCGF